MISYDVEWSRYAIGDDPKSICDVWSLPSLHAMGVAVGSSARGYQVKLVIIWSILNEVGLDG